MLALRLRKFGMALVAILALSLAWHSSASAKEGPDPETIDLGGQLYAENCAVCHGASGEGRAGATLAKDWPSIRPDLRIRSTIMHGIPGTAMPPWSKENGGPLSVEEIDAIVAYILTWQSGTPKVYPTAVVEPRPELSPVPEVEGDPNNGALLYDQNCAVCHGPNGEGRVGATLARNWPSIRPDLTVKATIERGVPGSPMPAWDQAHGGPLNEQEINDLTAFILAIEPISSETGTQAPIPPEELPNGIILGLLGILAVVLIGGALLASKVYRSE